MNRHDEPDIMDNPANSGRFSIQLPNRIEALSPLAEALEAFGHQANWPDSIVMQINLVLEELLVNAIDNGYPDGREGQIDIQITSDTQTITIRISDDGDAFNPFLMAAPDLTLPLEDRPIGGLGIHLVRSYMDDCAYCYVQRHNQVTLTKHLPLFVSP